jgi:hypothetical protein
MYQLQVLTGEDLSKAVQSGEIQAMNLEVTHTFLVTSFNYLTGKWEGINNPLEETLMAARDKRRELEQSNNRLT